MFAMFSPSSCSSPGGKSAGTVVGSGATRGADIESTLNCSVARQQRRSTGRNIRWSFNDLPSAVTYTGHTVIFKSKTVDDHKADKIH